MLDYSNDDSDDRLWGLALSTWVQIVTVAVLMCALFRFNLIRLWGKTNPINGQDPNWQHSVFVPLIGIYYLYIHREELLRAVGQKPKRELAIRVLSCIGIVVLAVLSIGLLQNGEAGVPLMLAGVLIGGLMVPAIFPTSSAFGTAVLLEGLLVFAFGIFPGQNDYVKDLGMVITLFGAATLLAGWPVMRVAWFPIAFLIVALPWPELVYARLAWPLQQLAASAAVGTLRVSGVTAQNFGTRIMMFGANGEQRMLNVAEACAGLKSVMTFLMVAGTVAFLTTRPVWEKVVIMLSAIPIAIFCNVVRVAGQGILDFYGSHEWSEGFAHQFAGLVMLIPGFLLIVAVQWTLDKLFIEEVDRKKLAAAGNAGGSGAAAAAPSRSKRMIVEVPRRDAAITAPPTETPPAAAPAAELPPKMESALVAPPAPAPAARPAPVAPAKPAAPPAAKPAAPAAARSTATTPAAPTNVPPAPQRPAPASGGSTLKPSAPKPPAAAAAPPPSSTLKPSSKPAAPRPVPPASGLKPSTLKPSASKPPSVPPQSGGLKPPSPPSSRKPQPPAGPTPPTSKPD